LDHSVYFFKDLVIVTVLDRSRDIYCYMLSAKFLYLDMREKGLSPVFCYHCRRVYSSND